MLSRLLSATALVGALSLVPSLALAQAVPDANSPPINADGTTPTAAQSTTAQSNDGTAPDEILVTGSRIRRANDESPNPITTITAQDIFSSGRVSIGDVLWLDGYRIEGHVHLPPELGRFSDAWESVMRDHREFVPVTTCRVTTGDGDMIIATPSFIEVRKSHIRAVFPMDITS